MRIGHRPWGACWCAVPWGHAVATASASVHHPTAVEGGKGTGAHGANSGMDGTHDQSVRNRLARLQDAGVSIWLDTLSRELLDSGEFAGSIAKRGHRRDVEPDHLR